MVHVENCVTNLEKRPNHFLNKIPPSPNSVGKKGKFLHRDFQQMFHPVQLGPLSYG